MLRKVAEGLRKLFAEGQKKMFLSCVAEGCGRLRKGFRGSSFFEKFIKFLSFGTDCRSSTKDLCDQLAMISLVCLWFVQICRKLTKR